MKSTTTPPMSLAWIVWGLGAVFYLMGFFQRVAPAVITSELMREFDINAAALGNLSAFYFYSYVAMQIPTGILADRWGPRRLLTLGTLVASMGAVMFALAPGIAWAAIGRLLIGGSVAVVFALYSSSFLFSKPRKRRPIEPTSIQEAAQQGAAPEETIEPITETDSEEPKREEESGPKEII